VDHLAGRQNRRYELKGWIPTPPLSAFGALLILDVPHISGTVSQTISHYCVVDKIGADGMGVAYCAQDEQLEREVALKVLPVGALADEEAHAVPKGKR